MAPARIQQQLLVVLETADDELNTFDLAAAVYEIKPRRDGVQYISEAQLSAVRRALISLAKKGRVCGRRGYFDSRQRWALPHVMVRIDEKVRSCGWAPNQVNHGRDSYESERRRRR